MGQTLADRIEQAIEQAAHMYNRLVLVVAPSGAGKTAALQTVHRRTQAPLINVNLELSRRLLDLTQRQRALQLPRILSEIISAFTTDVVLLDNIEVLFDASFQQDPLRLLLGLSRNRTVVAAWNGSFDGKKITYAVPGHPEYRQGDVQDFLIVSREAI